MIKFTQVMHCSCDDRFRSCLKMVDSQASAIVGNFFFNVGNTKCFVFKMEEVGFIWHVGKYSLSYVIRFARNATGGESVSREVRGPKLFGDNLSLTRDPCGALKSLTRDLKSVNMV